MIDEHSPEHERWSRNRIRLRLFFGVVALGAVISGIYSFSRAPVYESRLRVLVEAAIAADSRAPVELSAREVERQRQMLTTGPVLEATIEALATDPQMRLTAADARQLLGRMRIETLGQSDILQLGLRGGDEDTPPRVLNAWINAYQSYLDSARESEAGQRSADSEEQLARFEQQLAEKRAALEAFRAEHGILSNERSENEVLARLNGLNESLSLATDEESRAAATVRALEEAISDGQPVARPEDSRVVADLERRANDMREKLKELRLKFTDEYIAMDVDAQALVRQLEATEARLAEVRAETEAAALAEARRLHRQAIDTRRRLENEIAAVRADAGAFSNRFAEQQAMQLDLEKLEERYRALLEETVAARVDALGAFSQLKVLETASLPADFVGPPYLRDFMIGLGGTVLGAALIVLLFELIIRPVRRDQTVVPVPVPYGLVGGSSSGGEGSGRLIEGQTQTAAVEDKRDRPDDGADDGTGDDTDHRTDDGTDDDTDGKTA